MLNKRVLTAAILIPLTVITIIVSSNNIFAAITGAILLFAAWEWTGLAGLTSSTQRLVYIGATLILMGFCYLLLPSLQHNHWFALLVLLPALIFWIYAFITIKNYKATESSSQLSGKIIMIKAIVGWVVLLFCWIAMNLMRLEDKGPLLVLYFLVLIWLADTSAYYVGRGWGKKKLSPIVSPGKTMAGFYAALGSALIFGVLSCLILALASPLATLHMALYLKASAIWVVVGVVTVMFSIVGDLFISVYKRQQGMKDTGNLLPGHGGLLDRIDSMTAAAPIFMLGITILELFPC